MDIEKFIDNTFCGCCMAVQNEKIVFSSATGFSDLANEIPNTLETKFATASAGKVFVAVAILQLIDRNVLKFEDTLGKLLDFNLNHIGLILKAVTQE